MKSTIVQLLATQLGEHLDEEAIKRLIEIPPTPDMGDFAFPCFSLARLLRKSPVAIAEDLMEKLSGHSSLEKITAITGYCNFFVNKAELAASVLTDGSKPEYGKIMQGREVVIEFASPNTNKPLHLGHLRNMAIGEGVARIMQFCGDNVIRTSINNDRGVHICKSMLAYRRLGNNSTPKDAGKKSDHFVGDFYVLFSGHAAENEEWNSSAQNMLLQWESGDGEIRDLWKKMNEWALSGFKQTYELFGIRFDQEFFESDIYLHGKEIINEGLDKGTFSRREDGATVIDLESEKLGEKVLLRPDGTSVYIVQDLYLAVLKNEKYHYDRSIYVVGNEQEYHFSVLKAIFKKLDYDIADKIHHLSYGMVELPEGKMKSREGTVVDADDLITETQRLASEEVRNRYELTEEEITERSLKIALAAIKYQLLRVDITKNMLFDPKKAISFEGDTGPYLLYSYARSSSILRKAGPYSDEIPNVDTFNASEASLLRKLDFFPEAVSMAYEKMSPSVIANYTFELAQAFNEFYHNSPVIGSDRETFRLHLVAVFRSVLKKSLHMLGIEPIEEM